MVCNLSSWLERTNPAAAACWSRHRRLLEVAASQTALDVWCSNGSSTNWRRAECNPCPATLYSLHSYSAFVSDHFLLLLILGAGVQPFLCCYVSLMFLHLWQHCCFCWISIGNKGTNCPGAGGFELAWQFQFRVVWYNSSGNCKLLLEEIKLIILGRHWEATRWETARTSAFIRHLHWIYIKSFGAACLLVVMSCSLMINTEISRCPWGHYFSVLSRKNQHSRLKSQIVGAKNFRILCVLALSTMYLQHQIDRYYTFSCWEEEKMPGMWEWNTLLIFEEYIVHIFL